MQRPHDARDTYLTIATRCFAQHGYHGASLALVAREAGVTKQALLHFFGTKEQLYKDVLEALAQRLSDKIDTIDAPNAELRLVAYFDSHAKGALSGPDDARLVIRALLDSDAAARIWPLKPYLDKLVAAAKETERWRGATHEDVLAGLYMLIGSIQYFAISVPTLSGMYGDARVGALIQHHMTAMQGAVQAFAGVAPSG